jgi:hypothetical protein
MRDAIQAVRTGFEDWASDPALNAARQRMHAPSGVRLSVHPGMSPSAGAGGVLMHCEWVRAGTGEQHYDGVGLPIIVLYSAEDARLKAILCGDISCAELPDCRSSVAVRTAAVSALGTFAMAREDARTIGILGTGDQARHHLLALAALRKPDAVVAFGRDEARRLAFCDEMSTVLGQPVTPVGSAEEAVRGQDIVITATNSNVPVLEGGWLTPGQHVTSIVGSNVGLFNAGQTATKRRELDDESVRRAARIGIVSKEQAQRDEQADIYEQGLRGVCDWDSVVELTELLVPSGATERRAEDITIFKNNAGMGIADVALATEVARRLGAFE